jgi:NADP-dependent 3-hydroxy acid dehydrogenase YdfG
MDSFKDKVAVVTGGAQGIGRCIDGGMTHQMIYHGNNGWKLEK